MRHSRNYYRVRTGVRILFWAAVAVSIWMLATHIWWTGSGWTWAATDPLLH
jgi:hypothetical protein